MIQLADGQGAAKTFLQTAFVSDVHLGSRYCQADRFYQFLVDHRIEDLYLVGDIIDGWRLRQRWRWPEVYHRIVQRLLEMQSVEGTRLHYAPGNHDEFLRHYLRDYGIVRVEDEFIYETVHGGRMLVLHGDRFDAIESRIPWLSTIGASAYEMIMWLNHTMNRLIGCFGCDERFWSGSVKQKVKTVVKFISDFESTLAEYARMNQCEGIICGHIHVPAISNCDGIAYCNTGDWVEHCTALIEQEDGTWELMDYLSNQQFTSGVSRDGKDLLQRIGRGQRSRLPSRRDHRQLTAST